MRKALNVEPLLRIERCQLRWSTTWPECHKKVMSCRLHPRGSGQEVGKGHVASFHPRPCLVPFWCGGSRTISDCWKSWVISSPPRATAPATHL